jgi:hypothetical protein
VTLLASAGMAILTRAALDAPVTLIASPGSIAAHVLDLVGLPHTTDSEHTDEQADERADNGHGGDSQRASVNWVSG